jgi:hypothetical protein
MPLSQVGGGYQFGDGNSNEAELRSSVYPLPTYTASATLTTTDLFSDIIIANGTSITLTTPSATVLDAALANMRIGHFFEFGIVNINATNVTVAGGTGVTIVGATNIIALAASSSTQAESSSFWRLMKTAATGAYNLYRIS